MQPWKHGRSKHPAPDSLSARKAATWSAVWPLLSLAFTSKHRPLCTMALQQPGPAVFDMAGRNGVGKTLRNSRFRATFASSKMQSSGIKILQLKSVQSNVCKKTCTRTECSILSLPKAMPMWPSLACRCL